MGLFNRKAKPGAPKLPVVFVTHEDSIQFVVSRFFFTAQLMRPWHNEVVGGRTIRRSDEFLPDRETYLTLVHKLHTVIDESDQRDSMMNFVRCYPFYIALTWDPLKQPEEYIDEMQKRIEKGVTETLAEYFGWEKPFDIGSFSSNQQRLDLAERLRVSWTLGSRH